VTEKSNAEELVNDVQKEVKFKRYLLKNVDKLKEAISNIEGSIRGIEYIRKRIKEDKPYHKRIKGKIERILLQKMN
jgi:RNAse (barnase) inhibitor barstar